MWIAKGNRKFLGQKQSNGLHKPRRFFSSEPGQNLTEKIVQKFLADPTNEKVYSGFYVTVAPKHVMTHDNTAAVINKFTKFFDEKRKAKLSNPRQLVFTTDHNIQDKSEQTLSQYRSMASFSKEFDVDYYPPGRGIGHQIMCEEGYAWPGTLVVASDSHSNMYGGLGALGTPVVRTDAAAIWAQGKTWWQIPPVTKVILKGQLRPGVLGKDVIIALCGIFNKDQVLNHAIEFAGDGVASLSIEERLTIANMTTEWGTLTGLFPIDDKTIEWLQTQHKNALKQLSQNPTDAKLKARADRFSPEKILELKKNILESDKNASFAAEFELDLATVTPHVSGPNDVKTMTSVHDMQAKKMTIHKAYLVSCVNSRVDDLSEAARIVDGKKVAPGVQFYLAAASSEVQLESESRGDWQKLVSAGARVLPPGCGPCIGLGVGLLEKGEVGISATNRNFKGRMGHAEAKTFLASPAVVAASALKGYIALPEDLHGASVEGRPVFSVKTQQLGNVVRNKKVELVPGFPKNIQGKLLFIPKDNLNTDGIYHARYTYDESVTPEKQAQVVMENYDPNFVKTAKKGDILVGSFNFGTGSSREQAATALKYFGIPLLLAGSFSETFKRNALNNGYLCVEVPELVHDLKKQFEKNVEPTIVTNLEVNIDFENSALNVLSSGKQYPIGPVGKTAQELILTGGLENWVVHNLQNM